ncbi:hypothetical protein POTOM_055568 [Populus tomentosa]|uniref:GRAM domain-containing protein n=1 Tax=Populus tomentosa TaxID=118781 RepID=A0A8X7Y5D3_POPTO|nr:hypothetical protein POTOM_055568 [Populus tomentosa]
MSHRKISPPQYEQTGTPSSSTHPVRSAGLLDTMKFEAKKIRKGGRRNIFNQKFDVRAGEKLLKASHCFFSFETGSVAGLLFISTEKIAFCSQRSIAFNFPILQQNQTVEQFEIPLRSIRWSNYGHPQQKILQIRTEDNSEFLFMDFLRYEKARQNFEKAMRKLYQARMHGAGVLNMYELKKGEMSQRKIPPPHYEQTGTPSSCNHHGAAWGSSSTIANYFDRVRSAGLLDTMKFEAEKIRKGGRRNIFKQKFDVRAGEKLLKASHCFFSNGTGAVAGLLFISTEKIAFCSQRSIAFNFPNLQPNQTVEQFEIPLRSIRWSNYGHPQQKILQIRTKDNSEFLFMDFLRYEKARQNFEKAMRKLYQASIISSHAISSCNGPCNTLNDCDGQLICIKGKCNDDPDVGTHICKGGGSSPSSLPPSGNCPLSGERSCKEPSFPAKHKCSPPVTSTTKAKLTLNNFSEGGEGGAPSECDERYHAKTERVVALSTGWYDGGSRCGRMIKITASNGRSVTAKVVDECDALHGLRLGAKLSETVKGKLRLGAKTTQHAGIWAPSTDKIAFCSERPITIPSPNGQFVRTPYKDSSVIQLLGPEIERGKNPFNLTAS